MTEALITENIKEIYTVNFDLIPRTVVSILRQMFILAEFDIRTLSRQSLATFVHPGLLKQPIDALFRSLIQMSMRISIDWW